MICISLIDLSFNECLNITKTSDMVEVRMDKLMFTDKEYKELFGCKTKTIATCRPDNLSAEECKALLENAIRYGADYIDIEIENSSEYKKQLIALAKKSNTQIIIS
jgi:3-dehydroquinate dehydratase